jgi:hypothetical protein
MSTRAGEILRGAADIVDGARNSQHGDKERSFECIAEAWAWYIGHMKQEITPKDVANMMVLLKIGRSLYGEPITDHFMDMAGYAAIAGELAEAGEREDQPSPATRAIFGDPEAAKALRAEWEFAGAN